MDFALLEVLSQTLLRAHVSDSHFLTVLFLIEEILSSTLNHSSMYCLGASIRAARATNRHILALESDSKLFEEVLKLLQASPKYSLVVDLSSTSQPHDDDDDIVPDEPLDSLCE